MSNLTKFLKQIETNTCVNNMVVKLTPEYDPLCGMSFVSAPLRYNPHDIELLVKGLESGNCKPGLTIDLTSNRFGDAGAKAFAVALKSPNRPKDLWVNLSDNKISDKGFGYLADAIVNGPITAGLTLYFRYNNFTGKSAAILANALEEMIIKNKCPANLVLDFGYISLGNDGATMILNALQSAMAKNPARQTIDLLLYNIHSNLKNRIQECLEELRNRPAKSTHGTNKPTFYSNKEVKAPATPTSATPSLNI